MSLTPSEWDAIQERAVNPFRSNESNAVNRLTRIITLGDDVILKDGNLESIDYKTIKVLADSYIKDDVYIQFDDDVNIDFTDEGNYYSLTDRGMDRPGTYYLTLHYVYNESIPNPIATFKILKHEEELTEQFLLLCECEIAYNQSDNRYEILSFDTEKVHYVNVQNLRKEVDPIPTENSTNPVSSGGVYTALSNKQNTLTFDSTPTANSSNPVTSDGIKSYVDDSASHKQDTLTFDNTPTSGSNNPVTSGGIKTYVDDGLNTKQNALTFDNTPTAGSTNPVSSDGIKSYIDSGLSTKQNTLTFDNTPTSGSNNPVTSDGVYSALSGKQATLTFDNTPTSGSNNPVTSGGIKSYVDSGLNTKQNTLTFDNTPTTGSTKPVYSGGIKSYVDSGLNTKQNTLTFDNTPTASSSNPVTSGGIKSALDTLKASLSSVTLSNLNFTADGSFYFFVGDLVFQYIKTTPKVYQTTTLDTVQLLVEMADKQYLAYVTPSFDHDSSTVSSYVRCTTPPTGLLQAEQYSTTQIKVVTVSNSNKHTGYLNIFVVGKRKK